MPSPGATTASGASLKNLFGVLTVKRLLIPLLTHPGVAHVIKWCVYTGLLLNFGIYIYQDFLAWQASQPPGTPITPSAIITEFATTVDVAAWVLLIVILELETYVLPEHFFNRYTNMLMFGLRLICYLSIVFAAFGYLSDTLDYYDVTTAGPAASLCELAGRGIYLQLNVIDYVEITAGNCATLPYDGRLFHIGGDASVIDGTTLELARGSSWMDVSNAVFWILVVLLIEVEVWLQSADRFFSRLLVWTRFIKTCGYLVLIGNGVVWALDGYYLYAWDAFLWIFGFWAIELNLAEWEIDRLQEMDAEVAG